MPNLIFIRTYPSALASARPMGIHVVSVAQDSVQGMSPDSLRTLLAEWDVEARGFAR